MLANFQDFDGGAMGRGISILVIEQIKELQAQGKPIRKISIILGISRNTVRRYLRDANISKESPIVLDLRGPRHWKDSIPWEEVIKKRKSGYQIDRLHREYCNDSASYWSFNRAIKKFLAESPEDLVSIPQIHKPGEKVQVDYMDGVLIYDRITGKTKKTNLFCGVLAYSGYVFAEFSFDQKLHTFIRNHENMWDFFGGITPYVVPDNLKSAVHKAHRYDPITNPTYCCDFGNHCGFAVLPTRPYRPRDKGKVEANIGAIQRSFMQEVRDIKFYCIDDLNITFKKFLTSFNQREMKDYGVSRLERFQSEKDLLLPLPRIRYDLVTWHEAKVHPDCHIQIGHCYYSVPFRYIGQMVRVKKGNNLLEIFSQTLDPLACHTVLKAKGRRSTVDSHFPDQKLQASRFEIKQAMAKARAIGTKMTELIENIFANPRPLTGLRRAQGILRTWGKDGIDADAMEYAAGQCLTFAKYHSDYFRSCAIAFQKTKSRGSNVAPNREPAQICLREVIL